MRNNQIEIKVTRLNSEIPQSIQEKYDNKVSIYTMNTYTDSNNIFEALAAAYLNILKAIKEDEDFPKFGDNGKVKRSVRALEKQNEFILLPDKGIQILDKEAYYI